MLGDMKQEYMHCYFISWRKTDQRMLYFNTDLHRIEWMRPVVFHMSRVCLAFFFFFFSFIAWTLIELTAAIITSSEPAPDPPISSCEKAQFCLSFPKRKHIIACKTRSSARDDWASQRLQRCHLKSWRVPPKKKTNKKQKKKSVWMKMFVWNKQGNTAVPT